MIWIVGCQGMLGKELSELCTSLGMSYTETDRECDITDLKALQSWVKDKKINWIINCSAYTAVDKAEDEEQIAYSINATGAGNIASIAASIDAKMIHISTDYVFAGDATVPYMEEDPVKPAGAYGRTKSAGEEFVTKNNPKSFIIRTAWLYGRHGNNFVHTMLRLFKERDSINVVNDQYGCPTWTRDLADVIVKIIKNDSKEFGIYHFTGSGKITWYDFAIQIYEQAKNKGLVLKDCTINAIDSEAYPSKVKRPKYSVLNTQKISSLLGISISDWKDSLDQFFFSLEKQ
jgi:dTDP-4-dehydrorhamnose reductase